jgi:hypothetical protein
MCQPLILNARHPKRTDIVDTASPILARSSGVAVHYSSKQHKLLNSENLIGSTILRDR